MLAEFSVIFHDDKFEGHGRHGRKLVGLAHTIDLLDEPVEGGKVEFAAISNGFVEWIEPHDPCFGTK